MRYTCVRYPRVIMMPFLILMLLLTQTPSTNSTPATLQQEFSIQNTGNILTQDNFTTTIFFQYGAESGVLQPLWDIVGASGSGSTEGAYTEVDTAYARTGNYSIHIHQPPLPKSDAQRRVVAQYVSHTELEFYLSFWGFFPTEYYDVTDASSWIAIGGLTLYWVNPDLGFETHMGLRLRCGPGIDATGWYIRFTWSGQDNAGVWDDDPNDPWGIDGAKPRVTGTKIYATLNTWTWIQVYIKVSTGTNADGAIAAWINDQESLSQSNIPTNPSYWGYPEEGSVYTDGRDDSYYKLNMEQYGDQSTTPELDVWFDDIVAAMEKVPETYRVKD